jgi:hypothetical protein
VSWGITSPKDSVFPETIPEEASSLEEERVVIFQLPQAPHLHDLQSFYTVDASVLHQSNLTQSRRGSKGSVQAKEKLDKYGTRFDFDKIEAFEKV